MESSLESYQSGGALKPKPALAPKPHLAPKPFSLQKNSTIRSIQAPKTVHATSKGKPDQIGISVATGALKPTLTPPAQKAPQTAPQTTSILASKESGSSVSVHTENQPSKALPHSEGTPDLGAGVSGPSAPTTPVEEAPKSESVQKDDVIQTNHKACVDTVTNPEQNDRKNQQGETQVSDTQKLEEASGDVSSATNSACRSSSTRKRLPMELTSKFESGAPLLPQKPLAVSKTSTKHDSNKPSSSNPEQNQQTPEPSNRESDAGGLTEDYSGGSSIKRRISLLFDSSSRPEVVTKREDPEIMNGIRAVKERIKNWAAETGSEGPKAEKKPPVAPKTKSFEPATAPAAEITPKMPEIPRAAEAPAEQPTETQLETPKDALHEDKSSEIPKETSEEQSKAAEGDVQPHSFSRSTTHPAAAEGDSGAEPVPKRDKTKRRSVRFGTVVSDDGGPPVILGSDSESSAEDEEKEQAPEDEPENNVAASVPVYRRVGILQRKDDGMQRQEEERLKHLELLKRQKEEERQQARLKLEEEQKLEEEREREKAREREELRLREEEMERQRIQEVERERQRLKEEEIEMERLREGQTEKERQMEPRQKEEGEEREREEQKEKRLKPEQEDWEKEKFKEEEEAKEARLTEDRGRQRQREEEERLIQEHKEHDLEEKLREGEMCKEKHLEENCDGFKEMAVEREREKELELMKQRQEEEERERVRQMEERLRQEEQEKEQLRKEAEERERLRKLQEEEKMKQRQEEEERQRRALERKLQQEKEEEMERMRQIEKQREEERREEERKRQMEKERAEALEKKMQEELERQRADELKKKPRIEEDGERKEVELNTGEEETASDEGEQNLIHFDSEDLVQETESLFSPSSNVFAPTESIIDVVYDDFSVRKPLIEVDYDDFSVKPRRWGSQAREEAAPIRHSWTDDFLDKGEVPVSLDVEAQESQQEQEEKEQVLSPAQESPEKEVVEVLVDVDVEEEEEEEAEEQPEEGQPNSVDVELEEEEKEPENVEQLEMEEDHGEEEDSDEAKTKSYCINEDKEADVLTDGEPNQQNRVCEQTSETDSSRTIPLDVPEDSSDTTDALREADLPPLPESFSPLLDTSAQRSKADLGKKLIRSRPSRSLRAGSDQIDQPDWRVHDSTDENDVSSKQRESDSEEELPKPKAVCSPPAAQRVPVFPGMSPAALIAQIKKRTGAPGGGEQTEEHKAREQKESQNEEVAASPAHFSRSPRSAAKLAGAALVLPPLGSKDGGPVSSPAWLKELKSKKRMSQYDGET